jgi:membrane protein implicated in regulation of membrane protease activity
VNSTVYLGAIAFGVVLLVASLVIGGKDHDHDTWIPFLSVRFWIFLFGFGGATGYALEQLGESANTALGGAIGVGVVSGVLARVVIRSLAKKSAGSQVAANELVGATATVVLGVAPGKPGKVRVDVKGRTEDYIANAVEEAGDLPTGSTVMIVAEGDRGSLLVTKNEV